MNIDAVEMAQAFYESRNPGCKWHRLSWFEKVHIAVLAEREACAKVCEEKKSKYEERASKPDNARDIDPEVARIAKMTCDFNAAAIRARGET